MTHLGIVVGMADEAALLASLVAAPPDGGRMSVRVAGARPGRARTLADGLAADGVDALMSFGVAGGIDPALRPGTLIVASSVVHPGATVQPTDARWRAALRGALPGALEGPIVGSQRALTDVRDKRDHAALTAALAVDMESHAVAAAAGAAGLPFMALRAVADPADRAIPLAALAALDADGRARAWRALTVLAFRPWQLPALIRLRADHKKAMAALAGAAIPELIPGR